MERDQDVSTYACALCGKSFDQETSYGRHLQYCRRRAARKQPARPTACHVCRSTKSKCDFRQPCSRCVTKQTECSYGRPSGTTDTSATHHIVVTTAPAAEELLAAPVDEPWASTDTQMELSLLSPDDYIYSDTLFHPEIPSPTTIETLLAMPPLPKLTPSSAITQLFRQPADPTAPAPESQCLISISGRVLANDLPLGQALSPGCRRFITATLRTFPRLMAQPASWPPFIHPLACALHFDERDTQPRSAAPGPLRPLAACRVIAQGFVARTEGSSDFLWRSIEAEERWIKREMQNFSLGEVIAASQAMVTYTIMRLIESGPEYFITNEGMVRLMLDLGDRIALYTSGPFSPPHERRIGHRWEDWLCDETRRRIMTTCFCLALVTGTGSTDGMGNPFQLPLPCHKALWEAEKEWEWEREYVASWGPEGDGSKKLKTMCELSGAMRQRARAEGAATTVGASRAIDDVLDEWHAGLDGIGMMLSMVMGDV